MSNKNAPTELINTIKKLFDSVVGIPIEKFDTTKTFSELGMDSILGFEFIQLINKEFNCKISTAILYKHKQVDQFIEYLQDHLKTS